MSKISDLQLELFKYIMSEEAFLRTLEKEQNKHSDVAHMLEGEANADYSKRLKYIESVQEMRKNRAGVLAHHDYVATLQIKYQEMNNKLTVPEP